MNEHYSDEAIIRGIQAKGPELEKMVRHLYNRTDLKDWVFHYVIRMNGSKEDAEDVFQEGISHFVMNVKNGKYQSKSTLQTYFFGICKFIWFNKHKDWKKWSNAKEKANAEEELSDSPETIVLYHEQSALLKEVLGLLGEKCQQVLQLWALGYSSKEIVQETSYSSENVINKTKHNCMKKLTKLLKAKPNLVKLLNNK